MSPNKNLIPDLPTLRQFVQAKLCDQNELEPGAFKFSDRLLVRCNRPCGMVFCLYGPRQVKLIAIWDMERQNVIFYGSDGNRTESVAIATSGIQLPHSSGSAGSIRN
jgi:hypothetical protein